MECEAFTTVSVCLTTACISSSQIPLYKVLLYFLLMVNKLHINNILHTDQIVKEFQTSSNCPKNANFLYLLYRKLLFSF